MSEGRFVDVPISSLCAHVTSGGTPSRKESSFFVPRGVGIPWLKTKELTDCVVRDAEEYISEDALQRSAAKVLPVDTVLVAMYGATAGQLGLLGRPMACNQACCALLVDDSRADPRFLYYALLNNRPRLKSLANGAAQQNLSVGQIAQMSLSVPSLPEQRAIAEVLGVLDDKIEINRRMISTSTVLMQRTFEQVAAAGLAAVAQGKPLPVSWIGGTLGDWLSVLETGSRPKGGVAGYTSGVPSLGAESIVGLAIYDYSKTKYVPREFFDGMSRGIVEDRDVLLYKDGGRPGEFEPHVSMFGFGFPFEPVAINEHVYRLRASAPLTQEYLYCWLSSDPVMEEMRRAGTGVAIPGLNSTAVRRLPIMFPSSKALFTFNSLAESLVGNALRSAIESRALSKLRDTLLPKLLSGELRAREAESLVSEAT